MMGTHTLINEAASILSNTETEPVTSMEARVVIEELIEAKMLVEEAIGMLEDVEEVFKKEEETVGCEQCGCGNEGCVLG